MKNIKSIKWFGKNQKCCIGNKYSQTEKHWKHEQVSCKAIVLWRSVQSLQVHTNNLHFLETWIKGSIAVIEWLIYSTYEANSEEENPDHNRLTQVCGIIGLLSWHGFSWECFFSNIFLKSAFSNYWRPRKAAPSPTKINAFRSSASHFDGEKHGKYILRYCRE